MNRYFVAAVLFLPAVGQADTVTLKNGAWIDGKVVLKTPTFIELQIGEIGKIQLPMEEIYLLEKNSRTGLEKRETYVESKGKSEITDSRKRTDEAPKPEPAAKTPADPKAGEDARGRKDATAEGQASADAAKSGSDEDSGPKPKEDMDPALRKRIEDLVADLQREKSRNRVQAERHLEAIGQPTIPFLVPVARSENELTRTAVMRLFHSFGDQQTIEPCIQALLDENEYVREFANKALKRISGEDFNYQPSATPRRRELAQKKWADWWEKEKATMAEEKRKAEANR
jgi:hypothetical protein